MELVKLLVSGFGYAFGALCGIGLILTVKNYRKNKKLEEEVK